MNNYNFYIGYTIYNNEEHNDENNDEHNDENDDEHNDEHNDENDDEQNNDEQNNDEQNNDEHNDEVNDEHNDEVNDEHNDDEQNNDQQNNDQAEHNNEEQTNEYENNDEHNNNHNDEVNDDILTDINYDVIDSIIMIRETYLYNNTTTNNEYNILKHIYYEIVNMYNDIPLVILLKHLKLYYNLNLEQHNDAITLFYNDIYTRALTQDNQSLQLVGYDSSNNEIQAIQLPALGLIYYSQNTNGQITNLINNTVNTLQMFDIINNAITMNLEQPTDNTASNVQVNDLQTCKYGEVSDINKNINSAFCTICQENYENTDNIKLLKCSHLYHCKCIDQWLLNCSNLCPICRQQI